MTNKISNQSDKPISSFSEIEKKVIELEKLMDDSKLTKLSLLTRNGWRFTISHAKRHKIFMETHTIQKFVPDNPKGDEK